MELKKRRKNAEKKSCENCDFVCSKQSDLERHVMTLKHIGVSEKRQKTPKKRRCESCDFECSKESEWQRHILTLKHIGVQKTQKNAEKNANACMVCNKIYKFSSGLWKHSKVCVNKNNDNINVNLTINDNNEVSNNADIKLYENNNNENDVSFKSLILEIIKNNTELQKQNSELQKQLLDVCKNSNNTINSNNINSNNKTFNLQFFLNEQCKDAMNISDFVNSFDLQLDDLESVGTLGYVEGITKQFLDKLNGMDIYKRPMHCSDAKRETIYIKDENKWEKEERGTPKLRKAIKTVSFNNLKLVVNWTDTYPESKNIESRLNDKYLKLVKQTTGGNGELSDNEDKIIRRIAKEIIIDKV
jgi:hypothetical protein